jgi:lysophospholipase L1-like esterase
MRSFFTACVVVSCTTTACTGSQAPTPVTSEPAATGEPLQAPSRYLALGDSFTIGTGSSPEQSFPARLVARTACGAKLRNVAVNGYSTADILEGEVPEVATFAPTFVTLAAGANDIVRGATAEEYRARIRVILGALRAANVRRIVTLPQPDWSLSPAAAGFGDPAAIRARIVEANAILRDETAAAGGVYVDLFPMMQSQARAGWIARDGLHPSADAYDAWAAELASRGISPCA